MLPAEGVKVLVNALAKFFPIGTLKVCVAETVLAEDEELLPDWDIDKKNAC
jgi:hypothetical protein